MLPFEFVRLFPEQYGFWPWFFSGGIIWGIIGMLIAQSKGRGGTGCCLGCLLGPFGLVLTALLGGDRR